METSSNGGFEPLQISTAVVEDRLKRRRAQLRNARKNALRRASIARTKKLTSEADEAKLLSNQLLIEMRRLDALIDLVAYSKNQTFPVTIEDAVLYGFGLTETGAEQAIG